MTEKVCLVRKESIKNDVKVVIRQILLTFAPLLN